MFVTYIIRYCYFKIFLYYIETSLAFVFNHTLGWQNFCLLQTSTMTTYWHIGLKQSETNKVIQQTLGNVKLCLALPTRHGKCLVMSSTANKTNIKCDKVLLTSYFEFWILDHEPLLPLSMLLVIGLVDLSCLFDVNKITKGNRLFWTLVHM